MNAEAQRKTEPDQKSCTRELLALEDTLYAIGGKWKLKFIVALQVHGRLRFNELQRTLTGISARVLSAELKDLELNGFVERHVFPGSQLVVEYDLTAYSESLDELLQTMIDWGNRHRDKVRREIRKQRS